MHALAARVCEGVTLEIQGDAKTRSSPGLGHGAIPIAQGGSHHTLRPLGDAQRNIRGEERIDLQGQMGAMLPAMLPDSAARHEQHRLGPQALRHFRPRQIG